MLSCDFPRLRVSYYNNIMSSGKEDGEIAIILLVEYDDVDMHPINSLQKKQT